MSQAKTHFVENIQLIFLILSAPLSVITMHVAGIGVAITPFRILFLSVLTISVLFYIKKGALAVNKKTLTACFLISFLFIIYLVALSRKDPTYAPQANFRFLRVILFLSAILLTNSLIKNKNTFLNCLRYIVYTSVIISFLGFIDLIAKIILNINIWSFISDYEDPYSAFLNKEYDFIFQQRMTGTFFDSNLLAYYLLFPLAIVAYYAIDRKNKKIILSSKTSIIIACILSVTIILTLSRSGIFLMLSMWAMAFFKGKVKLKKVLLLVSIIIPLLIGINYCVKKLSGNSVTEAIVERFHPAESSMIDKEYMRIIRMKAGVDAISSNWLFGVGLGNLGRFIPFGIRKSDVVTSHSLYIDIMSEVGVLGFIFYILFIFFLILNIYKKKLLAKDKLNSMFNLFLCFLLMSQVVYSNLINPVFAIYLGVFLAFVKLFPSTKKKSHKYISTQSLSTP